MLECQVQWRRRRFNLDVTLRLAAGQTVALFGPSGAGKSTLLRILAGLLPAPGALIRWRGQEWSLPGQPALPPWRRPVGFLSQEPVLLKYRSVWHNCHLVPGATAPAINEALAATGLRPLARAMAGELSGGEAHRLAFSRLLLRAPEVALLDEPWAHLDRPIAEELRRLAKARLGTGQRLLLLVSHDWQEVEAIADWVVILLEGRVMQQGTAEEIARRPRTKNIARLIGYVGFVPAGGVRLGVHPVRCLPGRHPDAGPVLPVLGTRPTHLFGRPALFATLPGGVEVPLLASEADAVTLLDPPQFPEEDFR